MVACLETFALPERNREQTRSDYNEANQYSVSHPDALATGDAQGKGTGHGGHGHWLPNCHGTIGAFDFSNFDTDINSGAGNKADNEMRNAAMARSLYNQVNQYSEAIIDRSGDTAYMRTISSNIRGARTIGG